MEVENLQSEPDLLVFISSVIEGMRDVRQAAKVAVNDFPGTTPWLFEDMPANSDSAEDLYLRKVEESDIVIWLIDDDTSPAVRNEIRTCRSSNIPLLIFRLSQGNETDDTKELIEEVQNYVTWKTIANSDDIYVQVQEALREELVRSHRRREAPIRKQRLIDLRNRSLARIKQMWTSLGVPEDVVASLSEDPSIGDFLNFPKQGTLILVGDQGSGKTLAAERLFQKALKRAIDDVSQPIPVYVSATQVNKSLADYIENQSDSTFAPLVHGALVIIDGVDEVGLGQANWLIGQADILAQSNDRLTIAITLRDIPGLVGPDKLIGTSEWVEMPALSFEEGIGLVEKIAGRPLKNLPFTLSDSMIEAVTKPLWAVMVGVEIRNEGEIAAADRSQLVNSIAHRAFISSGGSQEKVDVLLQILAVKAVNSGSVVRKSDLSPRLLEQQQVIDSRLVVEHENSIDFALSVFREWFAARALVEKTVPLDSISPLSDRWLIPLGIALDSDDSELGHALMSHVASEDPGLASLLLEPYEEETRSDSEPRASGLEAAEDIGQKIHDAMKDWRLGLRGLYPIIGPVREDGSVTTLGVYIGESFMSTSWHHGRKRLPDVVKLPRHLGSPRDWSDSTELSDLLNWPTLTTQGIPKGRYWPWYMTRGILVDSLKEKLQSKSLTLKIDEYLKELVWELSEAMRFQGNLKLMSDFIEEQVKYSGQKSYELEITTRLGEGLSLLEDQLRHMDAYIKGLLAEGKETIREPWPSEDKARSSGWVHQGYSSPQLLARATAVYTAALYIYKEIVDCWFAPFRHRLRLYQLLPVKIEGILAQIAMGPTLDYRTYSLAYSIHSFAEFEIQGQDINDRYSHANLENYWREETERLSKLRPHVSGRLSPMRGSSVLRIFGRRPATGLAYQWLNRELEGIGWSEFMFIE